MDEIKPLCEAYVETVSPLGLPQLLWPSDTQVDGTELRDGRLFNTYYPSPEMHEAAARDLLLACWKLLKQPKAKPNNQFADSDLIVISSNLTDGRTVAELCGTDVMCLTYRQISLDKGLVHFLASSEARVVHVRRKYPLAFIIDRIDPANSAVTACRSSRVHLRSAVCHASRKPNRKGVHQGACPRSVPRGFGSRSTDHRQANSAFAMGPQSLQFNIKPVTPPLPAISEIPNFHELRAIFNRSTEEIIKAGS